MIVELHCHFRPNKFGLDKAKQLVQIADNAGVNLMCITEHTHQVGMDYWTKERIDEIKCGTSGVANMKFLVGQEVTTNLGDVLVFGAEKTYPKGTKIYDIDGYKIWAHPFRKTIPDKANPAIDAIEIKNKSYTQEQIIKTVEYAHKYNILGVTGSDIHLNRHVGLYPMWIPETNTIPELINNIKYRELI